MYFPGLLSNDDVGQVRGRGEQVPRHPAGDPPPRRRVQAGRGRSVPGRQGLVKLLKAVPQMTPNCTYSNHLELGPILVLPNSNPKCVLQGGPSGQILYWVDLDLRSSPGLVAATAI